MSAPESAPALPERLETSVNGNGEWDICEEGGGDMVADLSQNQNGERVATELIRRYNSHAALVAACEAIEAAGYTDGKEHELLLAALTAARGGK